MNNKKSTGERVADAIKDLIKALIIGAAAGGAVTLIFFLGGMAFGGSGAASGTETSKNVLFLCTAILLFILAGMILIKGKKPEKSYEKKRMAPSFFHYRPKDRHWHDCLCLCCMGCDHGLYTAFLKMIKGVVCETCNSSVRTAKFSQITPF